MRSQPTNLTVIALTAALAGACGKENTSVSTNASVSSPDLSLRSVAFARTADGRVTARGTAELLDYRRAGGLTEAVEYDGDLIHGEQPVALSGPGYVMRGNGMIMRTDGSSLSLTHGVTGALQAEAK